MGSLNKFQPPAFLRGIERSPIRQITDRAKPGDISFGLGEPDLPTPDVIRREALRVIQEEQNGYTLQAGLPQLRELVVQDYPHLNLSTDQVIITAGSQEAMYLALMTLVEAGDEVLIPNPGFVAYPTITSMKGGCPTYYQLPAASDFSFDLAEFKRQTQFKNKSRRLHQSFKPNRSHVVAGRVERHGQGGCGKWIRRLHHQRRNLSRSLLHRRAPRFNL